jgi:hypothetical protein
MYGEGCKKFLFACGFFFNIQYHSLLPGASLPELPGKKRITLSYCVLYLPGFQGIPVDGYG